MTFEVRVPADLRQVRQALKSIGDKGLGKAMGKSLTAAAKPLDPAIRSEASSVMPGSGGYRGVLVPSLRLRQRVKETRSSAEIVIRVYADGRGAKRDVRRLNMGQLRHPDRARNGVDGLRFRRRLWTKSRPRKRIPGGQLIPNSWSTTRIRPGFVDRPFDRLAPGVAKEMHRVIDDVAKQIKG